MINVFKDLVMYGFERDMIWELLIINYKNIIIVLMMVVREELYGN